MLSKYFEIKKKKKKKMTFAYHSTITILLYYVTKAFDAVDDLLLSQKSNNRFCFSNSSANLIYSYLTDRSQLVNVFGKLFQRII